MSSEQQKQQPLFLQLALFSLIVLLTWTSFGVTSFGLITVYGLWRPLNYFSVCQHFAIVYRHRFSFEVRRCFCLFKLQSVRYRQQHCQPGSVLLEKKHLAGRHIGAKLRILNFYNLNSKIAETDSLISISAIQPICFTLCQCRFLTGCRYTGNFCLALSRNTGNLCTISLSYGPHSATKRLVKCQTGPFQSVCSLVGRLTD